jgi:hypothetical protein
MRMGRIVEMKDLGMSGIVEMIFEGYPSSIVFEV